ncbi:MAG: hypothetical protein E7322_08670 [Clostridiales bacterium]|nr:hypothetical protein [Clostridiales bacterium]
MRKKIFKSIVSAYLILCFLLSMSFFIAFSVDGGNYKKHGEFRLFPALNLSQFQYLPDLTEEEGLDLYRQMWDYEEYLAENGYGEENNPIWLLVEIGTKTAIYNILGYIILCVFRIRLPRWWLIPTVLSLVMTVFQLKSIQGIFSGSIGDIGFLYPSVWTKEWSDVFTAEVAILCFVAVVVFAAIKIFRALPDREES